jgi:signal transduction histidine kinase/DNA-binding response OmpR family regulator
MSFAKKHLAHYFSVIRFSTYMTQQENTFLPLPATIFLLAGLLMVLPSRLAAQVEDFASLWAEMEVLLDEEKENPDSAFLFELVRDRCDRDLDCQFEIFYKVMHQLESRFDLPKAIFVGKELADVARKSNNKKGEAGTYINLSRFFQALGNRRQGFLYNDKALQLFEEIGDLYAIVNVKMSRLEQSLSYRKLDDVLPEMNALLAEAKAVRDTPTMRYLHIRLVDHAIDAKRWKEAENHVSVIEQVPLSEPLRSFEYGVAITAARGRARLEEAAGNLENAERNYLKALRFCEEEPSRWMEIYILHSLAAIAMERGNTKQAKVYLDRSGEKAKDLELDELLADNYHLKAIIAEQEERFADAYQFTKKKEYHNEQYESRSAGFDLQKHYLQLEKDQLAVEKEKNDLELNIKRIQLRNSLIIIALSLILASGFVFAFINLRGRKRQLEKQNLLISQQAKRLENLDATKSHFFANVSHELRTPITLLLGPIGSLLKEEHLTKKQDQLLQIAQQSGKQLEQLVTEILDLSKLEMGKMELDQKPTALALFFRRHLVQFESLATRKEIDFSFDIHFENDVYVAVDQNKIRQILNNLLSNAFKFTPPHGQIKTLVSFKDDALSLIVTDSGQGIHPDDLPHLFDRYFQTNRPDQPAEGGTGIGLALCHEYVQLMGGRIEAESQLGEGTTFRLVLPMQKSEAVPLTSAAPVLSPHKANVETTPASSGHASTSHLLIVEDNPELQDYLYLILSDKYFIHTAENGRLALEVLSSVDQPIDLIISDLMMPVMDGFQLLRELKSNAATAVIPVIMLTARADVNDRLEALRIGVDDYLLKPFQEEELESRIANLLSNVQARQEFLQVEPEEDPDPTDLDQEWLESLEQYVRTHLSNEMLSVPFLAEAFAMSESTLRRQIKRLTGLSPLKYLQEIRLHEARSFLEMGAYPSIAQIGAQVGYKDARSFSRLFKKRFGKLPSDYFTD